MLHITLYVTELVGVVGPESPLQLPFLLSALGQEVCVMVNGFPTYDLPITCALCGQPFKMRHAWRMLGNKLYCSEFCADNDKEEDAFQDRRRA
jgi:hypothetical protein